MSYEVLARKWRPQAFDEVSGQGHVTTPLRNAIRSDRVPHAILLTGPRGTGKTTLARILARCLNCEKGPTDTPCGECDACQAIVGGTSLDVQEIDAASRTSVDDVRELIQAIRYAPSPGKYRIFVVDEVHMLSTAAFNALLKTLEEPPPRSLFVFCTTNPEKIPFTVVSRCQRYDLRRISTSEMVERLSHIARVEKVKISEKSLLAVAREGDGSMRDAQTLLDQVIAFGGSEIDDDQVAQVLDLIDRRLLLGILEACISGDAAAALDACGRAVSSAVDAKRLGESLLDLLRDLVVLRIAPAAKLVEGSDEDIAELSALAQRTDATRLRRMFRALLKEQEDLAWAPTPFAVLEMALVRLASMPDGDDVTRLITRLDALERREPGGGAGPASGGAQPGGGAGGSARPARRESPRTAPASESATRSAQAPATHPRPAAPAKSATEASPPPASAPPAVVFDRLRGLAAQHNRGLSAAMEGGRLVERSESMLRIEVPHPFAAQRLNDRRDALESLCAQFFGHSMRIEIAAAVSAATGPGASDPEAVRQLRQDALNDPGVVAALDVLEGEIVEIRPLGVGA